MRNGYPTAPPNPPYASTLVDYNDEPPPYPLNEVTAIGWSPTVAIVEDNVVPNIHLPMPMPMVQNIHMPVPTVINRTLNNDRLTTERLPIYDFTSRSGTTTPTNVAPHIAPVSNRSSATSAYYRNINSPHTSYFTTRCGLVITFVILAILGVILVITIATVTRRKINVYNS